MPRYRPLIKKRFNKIVIEKGGKYIIRRRKDGTIKARFDRKTGKQVTLD